MPLRSRNIYPLALPVSQLRKDLNMAVSQAFQELDAECSFVLTQCGHNFGRRELLTVLGLLFLFYEHWHRPPKAQVVDGDLGVVAFCAKKSLYRPFFCFKNQASNPSVTGERLHKSHLMELSPSLY